VPQRPLAVVRPGSTEEVAAVLRIADETRTPVTARGSGTGLSGAAVPRADGIVVSFERMDRVLEIDTENHVAVVQPGVRLEQLDVETAAVGLVYPVFPGEYSASLGGNVATNAGGMRAVKYGVTRHQVLGLEAVLPTGEVIRTGGRFVKATTGYDLTQLITGSEGTLALVTEATLRLYPRPAHTATVLAPFATVDDVTAAVPRIVTSGIGPVILEYIDLVTMASITKSANLDLGIPPHVQDKALAYLVVMMEGTHADRLEADVESLATSLCAMGAMDAYVLPGGAAAALISAREKAFWVAKAAGADDIVDVVVPRASVPAFLATVAELAKEHSAWVPGCGHAGDGNVHMSVFQPDPEVRSTLLRAIFRAGMDLGGAISGEHGIGTAKRRYYHELEDPVKLDLLRRIKAAFDPNGILNPDVLL
jgi:glycolate oxidase